jgi:threonine/homoserine/homoserine lactone efflux protein
MTAARNPRQAPRLFTRLMLPFGIVMVLLSVWTLFLQAPGSAERIISIINIVFGAILIGIGFYLSIKESSNRVS